MDLPLDLDSNQPLRDNFNANEIFNLPNPNIRRQTVADADFEVKLQVLMNEVKERIEQLRQYGVAEQVLLSLVTQPLKLSRLVITSDSRILLPDYNNLEVKMPPLAKAVFFLFLRHAEGIMFKDLPDYKQELIKIYQKITNRVNYLVCKQSIERVCDPTCNAINEYCSTIRAAFIQHFDDRIAKKYYITGSCRTPKKIEISRELVKWDKPL